MTAPDLDTIDLFDPDQYVAGPPHDSFAYLRRERPVFRQAMPDIHVHLVHTVVEGDMVAMHCDVTGTHTGEGIGIPPTGKPVHFGGMCIGRFENGQIREGWNCFDFMTMYQQLGVLPAVPAATR